MKHEGPTLLAMSTSRADRTESTIVLAAVVQRDGRFLVCKRPSGKRHGGLWEFPGGKLEANESTFDAVVRELIEELGVIALEVGAPLFTVADPPSSFVISFIPTEISGEPVCLEHSELRWLRLRELAELPFAPSDRKFVDSLIANSAASGP